MLRDIEAQDAPENAQTEQPKVDRGASHQAKHGCQGHLKGGSFHDKYYGPAGSGRKEQERDEVASRLGGECFFARAASRGAIERVVIGR